MHFTSTDLTRQICMFTHDMLCVYLFGLYPATLHKFRLEWFHLSPAQAQLCKLPGENRVWGPISYLGP